VNKLPAAPASLKVSAVTSGVVAEPDDAGFGRLTVGLCLLYTGFSPSVIARNEAISMLYRVAGFERRVLFERPCEDGKTHTARMRQQWGGLIQNLTN
jgi:hypothetical protein